MDFSESSYFSMSIDLAGPRIVLKESEQVYTGSTLTFNRNASFVFGLVFRCPEYVPGMCLACSSDVLAMKNRLLTFPLIIFLAAEIA